MNRIQASITSDSCVCIGRTCRNKNQTSREHFGLDGVRIRRMKKKKSQQQQQQQQLENLLNNKFEEETDLKAQIIHTKCVFDLFLNVFGFHPIALMGFMMCLSNALRDQSKNRIKISGK